MRVFVTGASGFVGSEVVPDLVGAGHQVIGLARSDASAERVAAAGAEVQRGALDDLDSLRAGAAAADAVVHLAFKHDDFTDMAGAAALDRAAIEAMGAELESRGGVLVMTSGTLIAQAHDNGDPVVEIDGPASEGFSAARGDSERAALALAERGVRPSIVRLTPSVHGDTDGHGFIPIMVATARETGVSAHVGTGRWAAVNVKDAAPIYRLALEAGESGGVFHAVDDAGVPVPEIASIIGRKLGVPVEQISEDAAADHFGWFAPLVGLDGFASSAVTRERLGWTPTHASLTEDLEGDHYYVTPPAARTR